jgi:hypothetical protein
MQDIVSGRGVGVLDPHGDLFRRLLIRLSAMPEVWQRVVVLDPCSARWTVCFNPLEAFGGLSQERVAMFLTDVIVKLWSVTPARAPRMVWLLTNTFLALGSLGLTLVHLRRFLLDQAYRERLLPQVAKEAVRAYFRYEFPRSFGAVHQWVTPVLNKLGGLIFDPDLRLMLGGGSKLSFRHVLDRRLILLANLPKGILGEGTSALLGAFIVAHFQKAALSRTNARRRVPYFLYLDEFQNYTTDNIQDILSESRKYALSLILAHQYLDQLSSDLRSAVLNTAGTLVCFRVGHHDASRLAYEIFPAPDFLTTLETKTSFTGNWPPVTVDRREKPLGWAGLAQTLAGLPQRTFWTRKRGSYAPTKLRTLDMPDPVITPEVQARVWSLVEVSGQRFGRPKEEVRRELCNVWGSSVGDPDGDGPVWVE